MKQARYFLSILCVVLGPLSAMAQTPSPTTPPPGTISRGNATFGSSSLTTFTNRSGQLYTAEQFASQLENLRAAVEQTLPMVQAFNEDFAARNPSSQSLSGVLSRFIGGNGNGQGGGTTTNFLGILSSLLNTNRNNNTASASPTTVRDLQSLQKDLEPIPGLLQALNVPNSQGSGPGSYGYAGGNTNQFAAPSTNNFTNPSNTVTPTGR